MDIITTRRTKVEKCYQLLADITVGTATTSVDITGLNIGKGDEVVLVANIVPTSVDGVNIYLYANGNYTNTNYYFQGLTADNTTVSAGRENQPRLATTSSVKKALAMVKLKLTNSGYVVWQSSTTGRYDSTSVRLRDFYSTTTFTATSITSLRVASSSANEIGIGSRFQLYRIGGA